ncbi:MAG: zinc-dependent peptidase [Methylobacter sp.]|nr:zinc-dependent peptidase [Methylobacter sp.]
MLPAGWAAIISNGLGRQLGVRVNTVDMLNGSANGFPPLHRGMDIARWTASMEAAYQSLIRQVKHRHYTSHGYG